MRSARSALTDAVRCLGGCRHVTSSAILLIALVGGVLFDVALLPLLVRILRALLPVRGSRGHLLAVAGSLGALVLGGNRWHLAGHDAVSCCWSATSTGGTHRASESQKQQEKRHAVPTGECRENFRKRVSLSRPLAGNE